MSGIEKVCEFSGEYPGCDMYGYKRNSIQIMPKYRKEFKNADHVLHIFKPEKQWIGKSPFRFKMDYDVSDMKNWTPEFKDVKEWEAFYSSQHQCRVSFEYMYALQVFDSKLKGEVNGLYLNWSNQLSTVKRKIKRIIGCKKVNIQFHDMLYHEWREIHDKLV